MRRSLEQAPGGIYRYTSKVEMDRTFDGAYRKIDHPMTEFYQDCVNPGSVFEGAELLSINGQSMKNILEQLRSVITGDGNTSTAKDYRIGHNSGFTVYLHALGIRSPFRVTYRNSAGKRLNAEMPGLTLPERMRAWNSRNPKLDANADLKFLDGGNIAVLTIHPVSGYKYRDRGVLPDYPVGYTITELRRGNDKEMDLAIRLAKEKRPRDGAAKIE